MYQDNGERSDEKSLVRHQFSMRTLCSVFKGHNIVSDFPPNADEILTWRIKLFKIRPPLWRVKTWDICNILLVLANRLVIWLIPFQIHLPLWLEHNLAVSCPGYVVKLHINMVLSMIMYSSPLGTMLQFV